MPPDNVSLLKLVWHPNDISEDGEKVLPTAFRRDDLIPSNPDAHVSVDRQDIAVRAVMEATAEQQRKKANEYVKREHAFIGILSCGLTRSITFNEVPALNVVAKPIDGNEAHCGIQNATASAGRAYVNEVRGKLAMLASPPVSFDDAYRDAS